MLYTVELIGIKACIFASLYPFFLLLRNPKIRVSITICLLLAAILLQNRTLFCIVVLVYLYSEPLLNEKLKWQFSFTLVILLLVFAACINTNSLSGRLFIWKNICSNCHDVPLLGFGSNTFKVKYSEWQVEYFLHNEFWTNNHYVADSPSFAFNEPLHFYVEYGISAILTFSLLIYFNIFHLFRRSIPILKTLALSNLCIFVFSLMSYPLHGLWIIFLLSSNHILIIGIHKKIVLPSSLLIALLFSYFITYYYKCNQAEKTWLYAQSLLANVKLEKEQLYDSAYSSLYCDQYFLNDYCSMLLNDQEPEKAITIASSNRVYFNQYEYSLIMGNAYQQKNDLIEANYFFNMAHNIIPNRLIPLYNLMCIAKQRNQSKKYAAKIIATPIKVESKITIMIQRKAQLILDEID